MSTFLTIRDEIERIVGILTPPTLYLRQTGMEANVELENLAISQPIALHIDQTEIVANVSSQVSTLYKTYNIEIMFILKELEIRNIKNNSGRKAITRMQKQGLIIQQANGFLELSGGTPPLKGVSN